MKTITQVIDKCIDLFYTLEPKFFLFVFVFFDIFIAYVCYKAWKKWRKLNIKDTLIIFMWATMGLFLCFISPFRPDLQYEMKNITDNLSAFGPIITALVVAWISVEQYAVMNSQKDLSEKQDARQQKKEYDEKVADFDYLNLYLHLRLEYLLKFYNFVERYIPLIEKSKQQKVLTREDVIMLNTVPVDQNISMMFNLNKFTYTSFYPDFLRALTYVETNLKFLNSAIEVYKMNCKTMDIELFEPAFKNFKNLAYITAFSIYHACKVVKEYNKKYSNFDLKLEDISFDKAERKFLAQAIRQQRKLYKI